MPAKENREPARGWYQGMPGPACLLGIIGDFPTVPPAVGDSEGFEVNRFTVHDDDAELWPEVGDGVKG